MLLKYWDVLDKDHDGTLDKAELAAAQQMMGVRGRRVETSAQPPKAAATASASPIAGGK